MIRLHLVDSIYQLVAFVLSHKLAIDTLLPDSAQGIEVGRLPFSVFRRPINGLESVSSVIINR